MDAPAYNDQGDTSRLVDNSGDNLENIQSVSRQVTTYKRRWYILLMFAVVGGTMGAMWNTWGPIARSAQYAFNWSDGTIALFANWGPITYVVGTPLMIWIMDVKGVRWATLTVAFLTTVGSALRCISDTAPVNTVLVHVGQCLNGFGGIIACSGGPLISAAWFPAHQRTTATAIASMVQAFGVALSFIIGPLLVPEPPGGNITYSHYPEPSERDITNSLMLETPGDNISSSLITNTTGKDIERIRSSIMRYMYYECGWSALLLLLVLLYFPARPPTPPSITASIVRTGFFQGLKQLFQNRKFWILATVFTLPTSLQGAWSSVFNVVLEPLGVTQDTAGWIGFVSTVAYNASGIICGIFADILKKQMKLMVISLYLLALCAFSTFALMYVKIVPPYLPLIYITICLGNIGLWAGAPILFELSCECTYPVAEGTTVGIMTWLDNIPGLILLLIFMIPNIGSSWTNWTLVAGTAVSIPILLLFKEEFSRFNIDTQDRQTDVQSIDSNTPQETA